MTELYSELMSSQVNIVTDSAYVKIMEIHNEDLIAINELSRELMMKRVLKKKLKDVDKPFGSVS